MVKGTNNIKTEDLSFYTLVSIWESGALLQNDIEGFLKNFKLSHGRFSILLTLYKYDGEAVYPSVLSSALKKQRPTITDMVKKLVISKHVLEVIDPDDGRKKKLKLSKKGLQLLNKIIPLYNKRIDHFTQALTVQDKKQLLYLMSKLQLEPISEKIS